MGQTLPHGVYLPDEGERNCYDGLAGNWQLLDGAVGTVAEHSTQIAGKANAVHTHTKSDITDFPAYGNAAGTICEGNDSRLSDARTPVAHTHVTADVTDLLNSAHEWTADQTIASNRFLRVYGYRFQVKNASMELGTVPSSNQWTGMQFVDKNNTIISEIVQSFQGNGNTFYRINIYPNEANSQSRGVIAYTYNSANNVNTLQVTSSLLPAESNLHNLGSSNQKWKTLNGVNPGALSLPNLDSTQYDPIDFSQWNVSLGWGNYYTPQSDGWIHVNIKDSTDCSVFVFASNSNPMYAASAYGNGSQGLTGRVALMMPVRAGVTYTFMVKASSTSDIYTAIFFPALGNV